MGTNMFLWTILAGILSGVMNLSMKGCSYFFGFTPKQILTIMFIIVTNLYTAELYLTRTWPSFNFEGITLVKVWFLLGSCGVLCFFSNLIIYNQMLSSNINPAIPFVLFTGVSTLFLYLISIPLFGIMFSIKQFIALLFILIGTALLK